MRRILFVHAILLASLCHAATVSAQALSDEPDAPIIAQERPARAAPTDVPLNEEEREKFKGFERVPRARALQLRAGVQVMGLFKSQQGSPGIYPTIGLRYRGDDLYLDIHAPMAFGALDAGQFFIQRDLIGRGDAFDIFRALNSPPQYSYLEAGHVRIGKNFGRSGDWSFAAGLALFADFVVFDALFTDELPEADDDFTDFLSSDPFVVGPGGFISLGRQWDGLQLDWVLEIGRDLINFGSYVPVEGWVISTDVEVVTQLSEDWAAFLRVRSSMYTHLPGRYPISAVMTLGANVQF
jgi:hypothetical protein